MTEVKLNVLTGKNIDRHLVSVIIPCFNNKKWVEEAIQSVFNQTWKNLEILVFDDGSTDGSSEILESLKLQDSRLKIFGDGKNHGIVYALNYMLTVARGEYIARMDSDDVCKHDRIEKQVSFLIRNQYDACGSWFTEIGSGPSQIVKWPHNELALKATMLFQNTILHPTFITHRKVYEQFQYRESYQLAEDYDLFIRIMSKFRIVNIPESLLYYRRHIGQATQAKRREMETITQSIRLNILYMSGIEISEEEKYTHNLIRAPQSIYNMYDFERIESWLLKLICYFEEQEAKEAIASQWTRAAIRAAPLGCPMLLRYRRSPLRQIIRNKSDFELAILSILRLPYDSKIYNILRRFNPKA